ncbi:helix-turn-helix domain-containing protein [Phormidesmis sp. 146-35]
MKWRGGNQQMSEATSLTIDFAQEKEAGYERVFAQLPLLTSLADKWQGVDCAYDYLMPGATPEVSSKQHCVAIFTELSSPASVERTLGGCFRQEQVMQGDMLIVPATVSARSQWNISGGVIFLSFEPSIFAQAMHESFDPDRVELVPHFATPDPLVHQIGLVFKAILENPHAGSRLYAETMANALIVHLLQRYATQQPVLSSNLGKLSNTRLRQVVDYIHDHLDRDLSLVELATVSRLSSHYFSEQFKQSTGFTPHQYVIQCRVKRAKELLLQGELTIAEIARTVGFVDQSHLNRHFKRVLGVTPKSVLRN